ncbi:MAG TPA: hypothetical protein DCP63_14395 [Bacteroidetes bacterium]|nr:hypothetical protein [Bacteroidota bacterium]
MLFERAFFVPLLPKGDAIRFAGSQGVSPVKGFLPLRISSGEGNLLLCCSTSPVPPSERAFLSPCFPRGTRSAFQDRRGSPQSKVSFGSDQAQAKETFCPVAIRAGFFVPLLLKGDAIRFAGSQGVARVKGFLLLSLSSGEGNLLRCSSTSPVPLSERADPS